MADIRPFAAIRPKKGLEERIAALPYDVYNRAEARAETEREPYSFLKIDRAETQLPEGTDMYADEVYQKAHDTLWEMIEKGEFVQEEEACYYIYELVMDGRVQTGITACAGVDDYLHETIKKHENTRTEKELDRISHVTACKAQTGPIFLAYRSNEVINRQVERIQKEEPLYDFTSVDGITHRVWRICEKEAAEQIRDAFSGMDSIYIADGHHRCASAVKVGLEKRKEHPDYSGEEEFNYFLSVLFPDDQLMIMDYNRVVKDLNGNTAEEFLTLLKNRFSVSCYGKTGKKPEKKGMISMYLAGNWYGISLAEQRTEESNPVDSLDVSALQKQILEPLLGILDPRTDERIDFVGGIRGLGELERRVETDSAAAFAMYPTSVSELFGVADAGLLMPPKSTWFEPKLRSGLFIHGIE